MKQMIFKALLVIAIISFNGCAMYYRPISPDKVNYNILENHDGIELSYRYDLLRERGNKKMAKKELANGIKIIAVRLTNNTDTIVTVGKNIAFYSGLNEIIPMEPLVVKNKVRQSVIGYLPYFLGAFGNSNVTYNGRVVSTFQFGLLLWPGIAIGNMFVAYGANSNLLKELRAYDIVDKDIKPGETIYGIIGVRDDSFVPLTIRRL